MSSFTQYLLFHSLSPSLPPSFPSSLSPSFPPFLLSISPFFPLRPTSPSHRQESKGEVKKRKSRDHS